MKNFFPVIFVLSVLIPGCTSQLQFSGNPVFPGWYADPEGTIYNNEFWIFPTYSAPYEDQVFMDAFSSKDLTNWKKHRKDNRYGSCQVG